MSLFSRKPEPKPEPRLAEAEVAPPAAAPRRAYGIDDSIQLLRTLPLNQNPELVLLVVRNTLASMNVELQHVIDDGTAKQERLAKTLGGIRGAIAELEREMQARQHELAAAEADLTETSAVKEQLLLAAQRDLPTGQPQVARPVHTKPAPPAARPAAPKPPPIMPGSVFETGERETMEIEPQPESSPAPGADRS